MSNDTIEDVPSRVGTPNQAGLTAESLDLVADLERTWQHSTNSLVDVDMQIKLERLRLVEALSARDVVIKRFADACNSVRQKTATIEQLREDNRKLEDQLQLSDGSETLSPSGLTSDGTKQKIASEIQRLTDAINAMEQATKSNSLYENGHTLDQDSESVSSLIKAQKHDWQTPISKLLALLDDHDDNFFRNATTDSTFSPDQMATPDFAIQSPYTYTPTIISDFNQLQMNDAKQNTHGTATPSSDIREARNMLLSTLPLPFEVPVDAIRPIAMPTFVTIHEFLATIPSALRAQLGNYRVFQQRMTVWCPEREEHGYFVTPLYKCTTNPRAATAHRWSEVDVAAKVVPRTECFYNNNGSWYYAGTYRTFRLENLTAQEWQDLSAETTQTLIKETLSGRKNTSPQNVYETGQLYAAGALKVACIGLQCIGFNNALYAAILAHAAQCSQTGKWRSPAPSSGSPWAEQGSVKALPTSQPPSLVTSPGIIGTTANGGLVKTPQGFGIDLENGC